MSEQQQKRKILVAPAWPYASGKRHLGHVVGFAVPADIFARYHRLKGNDVLMVSGTDEHGTPVMVTADREGVSPREIAERYNELTREDLRDLGISYDCFTRTTTRNHAAVTRDIDWGIPVPVEGYPEETKRIYVWFDAVIGYLSAAVECAQNRGAPEAWRDWWQSPEALHAYFMGKDNIVFHTVIWPSMLLGYGEGGELGGGKGELHLPDEVVASEFLTMEGKQLSTSRAIAIYVRDVLERYDPDPVRYFLTAAGPETQDTDFTWAEFLRRNNDELLANWGNLVNRTLANAYRTFGEVPEPGELTAQDQAALESIASGFASVGALIEQARFKAALAEAMRLSSLGNQYVDHEAPWAVIKVDRERAATILYVALRLVDTLKLIFTPFLPFSSQKLHELLGYGGFLAGPLEFREIEEEGGEKHTVLTGDYGSWLQRWEPSELPVAQKLREPEPLFKKLDPGIVADELGRLDAA